MTTRRRLLMSAIPAVAAVLVVVVWLVWPRPVIGRANSQRIQIGMTLAEVETILRGPARDVSTRQLDVDECGIFLAEYVHQHCRNGEVGERFSFGQLWVSDHGMIDVRFDADGRVVSSRCLDLDFEPESTP